MNCSSWHQWLVQWFGLTWVFNDVDNQRIKLPTTLMRFLWVILIRGYVQKLCTHRLYAKPMFWLINYIWFQNDISFAMCCLNIILIQLLYNIITFIHSHKSGRHSNIDDATLHQTLWSFLSLVYFPVDVLIVVTEAVGVQGAC